MESPSFTADEMINAFAWSRYPLDKLKVDDCVVASPIHTVDRIGDFTVTPDNLSNPHRVLTDGTCDLYMGNYPLALINPSSDKPLARIYDNTTRKLVDIPVHLLNMQIVNKDTRMFIRTSGRFLPIYDNDRWNCDISKKGYLIGFVSKLHSDVEIGFDAYKVIYLDGTVKQFDLKGLMLEILHLHILNVYCPVAKSLFCSRHDTSPIIDYFSRSKEPISKEVEERVLTKVAWLSGETLLPVVKGQKSFESLHMNPYVGTLIDSNTSAVRDVLQGLEANATTDWADPEDIPTMGIAGCSCMCMRELYMCYQDARSTPYFANNEEPHSIFNFAVSDLNDGGIYSYNAMLSLLKDIIKTEGDLFALVAYLADGEFNAPSFNHRSSIFRAPLEQGDRELSLLERCAVLLVDLMVSTQGSHNFLITEDYMKYADYSKTELLRLKMMGINIAVSERRVYGGISLERCDGVSPKVVLPKFVNVVPSFVIISPDVTTIEISAENSSVTCDIMNPYISVIIDSLGAWSNTGSTAEHIPSIRAKLIEVTGSVLNIPADTPLRFKHCVQVKLNNTDSVHFRPLLARKIGIVVDSGVKLSDLVLRNLNPTTDVEAVYLGSFSSVWKEKFESEFEGKNQSLEDAFSNDYRCMRFPFFLTVYQLKLNLQDRPAVVLASVTCDEQYISRQTKGYSLIPMSDAYRRGENMQLRFVDFRPDNAINFAAGFAGAQFKTCAV